MKMIVNGRELEVLSMEVRQEADSVEELFDQEMDLSKNIGLVLQQRGPISLDRPDPERKICRILYYADKRLM